MKCDRCGGEIIFVQTPNHIHYGKDVCSDCGKWFKWIRNPDNKGKNRYGTSKFSVRDILKFHKKNEEICFFCLRKKDELGFNETITRDHIEEVDKGGKDELENLQVLCSACHKLKNWVRLYMNWHFKKDGNSKEGI